jgi:pimeloyl-ACP methyl ester carboxylesterase
MVMNMSKLYEFNPTAEKLPIMALSCANGFTPQAYERSLQPLFSTHRVVCAQMRPLWGDEAPSSLHNWRQLGDDLLDTLATVTDQPVIGVGHSVGGVATVYAALKNPSRFSHIILIDPTFLRHPLLWGIRMFRLFGQMHRLPLVQGAQRRRRYWESKAAAHAHLSKRALFKDWQPDVMDAFIDSVMVDAPEGKGVTLAYSPEWEAQIFKTVASDVWQLPQQITIPTLVIRGELTDVFTEVSARLFAERAPRARIEMVRGVAHMVPQEAPDEVGRLITNFLAA